MKIYIVTLESNIDGEVYFSAIPCASKEIAKEMLKKAKEHCLKESLHFKYADFESGDYTLEDEEEHFYLNDHCDDYYEDYNIVERELVEDANNFNFE